ICICICICMDNAKKILFCLPGSNFSGKFLDSWTQTAGYCFKNNISFGVSRRESCNIYYVRNMCLGADSRKGENQKPFNGEIDYDYLMWIDSDIFFTPQQFERLLSHDKDIVSGIYVMSDGRHYAAVKEWDEEYFGKHGHFQFLTGKEIKETNELVEVVYSGMGFMLVKKGVFESISFPWFMPICKKMGNILSFTTEDVAFCLRAREKGFRVWIDTKVRVGHEKKVIL
ncbi:MAG: hypothetical protein JXJ19_08585, partial [Elusimicrobia bacterium]|nr:hypothetical protein [Elusimicrobiota bacterium]